MKSLPQHLVRSYALSALKEDHYRRDVTTLACIDARKQCQADIIVKEDAVICGQSLAKTVFNLCPGKTVYRTLVKDGKQAKKGKRIASLQGSARSILTGERTALNFLGYLSGIATHTANYVDSVRKYKADIYDTRKTTPLLRPLEKYAVRCGGGKNHRVDLESFLMIKDNHRELMEAAETRWVDQVPAIKKRTRKVIEVEVDTLSDFQRILPFSPDIILCDNFTPAQLKKAVRLCNTLPKSRRPHVEASGGITLKNIKTIAATGIDRISIGALTHSRCSIDVSLEVHSK